MIPLSIPLPSSLGCVSRAVYNFSDILFLSAGTSPSVEWLLRELIHSAECWQVFWSSLPRSNQALPSPGLWKPQLKHPCPSGPFKAHPFRLKAWFSRMIGIKWRGSHVTTVFVWVLGFPRSCWLSLCLLHRDGFGLRWLRAVVLSASQGLSTYYFISLCKHSQCCCQDSASPGPVSVPSIIGQHFWSHRNCVPLLSETKHCICCSILASLQWLMETSKTAIYRFTFCLSSSVQRVLTHCPSNLISHAAFKCRAGPWPLSGGDSCQIQIVGYRSWLLKPTHSFLLQIIAHSLKPCFTVRRLAGKRSTYCISKVSQGDKG